MCQASTHSTIATVIHYNIMAVGASHLPIHKKLFWSDCLETETLPQSIWYLCSRKLSRSRHPILHLQNSWHRKQTYCEDCLPGPSQPIVYLFVRCFLEKRYPNYLGRHPSLYKKVENTPLQQNVREKMPFLQFNVIKFSYFVNKTHVK